MSDTKAPEAEGCQLYLISPPQLVLDDFVPKLEDALGTGSVSCFQLRLKGKGVTDAMILEAADPLVNICRHANVPFILNDRPDLALKCGADGVHIGQDDMGVKEARNMLGKDMVIGVSCHASKHLAMEAAEAGADYVAFGAFFPTKTKSPEMVKKWGTPTTEIIDWWCTYTTVPCVAIGGIKPDNCEQIAHSGADFIAVVTGVWDHPEGPVKAIEEYQKALALPEAAS